MAQPRSFPPLAVEAAGADRAAYLQRVLLLTFAGLAWSSIVSVAGVFVLALAPGLLLNQIAFLVVFFGGWAVVNFVAQPMVMGGGAMKVPGFVLGTGVQGAMMSYLLFAAGMLAAEAFGNPFMLIGLAAGLTFFTGLGLAAFAFTQQRDFSMLGAGLSALGLPMILLMGVSFAFPGLFGGTMGLVFGVAFVAISVGSLLYTLNSVIHRFSTDQSVEGAYTVTIGLLVLFWNILSLLMRLTRR